MSMITEVTTKKPRIGSVKKYKYIRTKLCRENGEICWEVKLIEDHCWLDSGPEIVYCPGWIMIDGEDNKAKFSVDKWDSVCSNNMLQHPSPVSYGKTEFLRKVWEEIGEAILECEWAWEEHFSGKDNKK